MSSHFENMSEELQEFWSDQKDKGNVKHVPRSGRCMLCGRHLTTKDKDHSVCNLCWEELGEEE